MAWRKDPARALVFRPFLYFSFDWNDIFRRVEAHSKDMLVIDCRKARDSFTTSPSIFPFGFLFFLSFFANRVQVLLLWRLHCCRLSLSLALYCGSRLLFALALCIWTFNVDAPSFVNLCFVCVNSSFCGFHKKTINRDREGGGK